MKHAPLLQFLILGVLFAVTACASSTPAIKPTAIPTTIITATPVVPTNTATPMATSTATLTPPTATPTIVSIPTIQSVIPPRTGPSPILFVSNRDGNQNIYIMNEDGTNVRRLTDNPAADIMPAWSPDHTKIAFISTRNRAGQKKVFIMNADGSDQKQVGDISGEHAWPTWTPDGKQITFSRGGLTSRENGVFTLKLDGSGLTALSYAGDAPHWRPDGRMLAAYANDNKKLAAFVFPADMTNPGVIPGFTVVSDAEQGEGLFPKWSSDGTRLAYISRKNITSSTICFTNERRTKVDCLRNDDLGVDLVFGVDWAPDGKRLVFYGQKARSANEIYIANVDGSGVKNLTNHAGNDEMPNWSP